MAEKVHFNRAGNEEFTVIFVEMPHLRGGACIAVLYPKGKEGFTAQEGERCSFAIDTEKLVDRADDEPLPEPKAPMDDSKVSLIADSVYEIIDKHHKDENRDALIWSEIEIEGQEGPFTCPSCPCTWPQLNDLRDTLIPDMQVFQSNLSSILSDLPQCWSGYPMAFISNSLCTALQSFQQRSVDKGQFHVFQTFELECLCSNASGANDEDTANDVPVHEVAMHSSDAATNR